MVLAPVVLCIKNNPIRFNQFPKIVKEKTETIVFLDRLSSSGSA
jgi:hypothetical protein